MAVDIGRIAFQAYAKSVNNETFDGKQIPSWEKVGQKIQNGWRAAAVAVLQQVDKEKRDAEEGLIG